MIRLRAIMVKEFLQIFRDRLMLRMLVLIPIVQVLLFGLAINTDVKHLPTVVFDQSLSAESREFLEAFEATDYYDVTEVATSVQAVKQSIESGAAKVGIVFPPDFAAAVHHGRSAQVQVVVDASDSMTANSAISTALMIGQVKSQERLASGLASVGVVLKPYDVRVLPWYNPNFISKYFMVPGILGMILTMTLIVFTAMAIVREREQGTLEQLLVTPLKAYELMIGKIVPYICIGYMQISVMLLVAVFIFDVPVQGHLWELYLWTAPFILATLTLGMLISTVAQSQMQAMQMSSFVLLPSVLLSGLLFPRIAMPTFFYYASMALPMTHYLEISRGIMLKGIGIEYVWQPVLVLCGYAMVGLLVALWRFRRDIG